MSRKAMLNFFLRLLTVLGALYTGIGIGGLIYGYFVNRMPIGQFLSDVVNPIRSFAALTMPVFIPVLSVRLIWGGTIASSVVCTFWPKCPWQLFFAPFITSIFLGYKIMDAWRSQ